MNAAGRLALYGAGLAVAFGGAFGLTGVAVPDSLVAGWAEGSNTMNMDNDTGAHDAPMPEDHGAHAPQGLSVSANGYVLAPVQAPGTVGKGGELRFQILDPAGEPVTAYAQEHGKDLHLIVVRSDGARFSHVHPMLDESTGTWSLPWTWEEAGTYRVYTDFTPAGKNASGLTLTRAVHVAGDFRPVEATLQKTDEVDGYTVTLDGDLGTGSSADLKLSVERDGDPVTTLEPYLGAYGHLVALREGDLAYLHVHPEGDEPRPGTTGGPDIEFAAQAPTAGRYLLHLDFQVDGTVHTAEFVLDAGNGDGTHTDNDSHSDGH